MRLVCCILFLIAASGWGLYLSEASFHLPRIQVETYSGLEKEEQELKIKEAEASYGLVEIKIVTAKIELDKVKKDREYWAEIVKTYDELYATGSLSARILKEAALSYEKSKFDFFLAERKIVELAAELKIVRCKVELAKVGSWRQ